jgi:DNA polymerase-3 subunit epsilon
MVRFVALDFETADGGSDSACAVGLAVVEGTRVVDVLYRLIKPPRSRILFTRIHGIHWKDVAEQPGFGAVWGDLRPALAGAAFIAAHWARFDRRVLNGCCAACGLAVPDLPFVCTVALARSLWQLRPARLPDVCRYLCIPLEHHHARSDALACARIVIAAIEDGWAAPVSPAPAEALA